VRESALGKVRVCVDLCVWVSLFRMDVRVRVRSPRVSLSRECVFDLCLCRRLFLRVHVRVHERVCLCLHCCLHPCRCVYI